VITRCSERSCFVVVVVVVNVTLRYSVWHEFNDFLNSSNISKLVLLLHLLQPGSTLPDTDILKWQIYPNSEVVF
jgi:hypothetical protein